MWLSCGVVLVVFIGTHFHLSCDMISVPWTDHRLGFGGGARWNGAMGLPMMFRCSCSSSVMQEGMYIASFLHNTRSALLLFCAATWCASGYAFILVWLF